MNDVADPPTPTIVAVNGVEPEVLEAGQHHAGNPIVLRHGWPEHAFSWRHQISVLADEGHHVIVSNQRGHGNSTRPSRVTDDDIAHLTGDLVGRWTTTATTTPRSSATTGARHSGFTSSLNWYRDLDRNRHLLGEVDPIVRRPALMIHGVRGPVAPAPRPDHFVPNVDVVPLDCGHWIEEELPDETNQTILGWLGRDRVA